MIDHRWSIMSSYHSLQFKYINFHIFTCILHHIRVCYELTMWLAPSWPFPDNSAVRACALHYYCRSRGFESRSLGLNFFYPLISQLLKLCVHWTAMINRVFISFSAVQIYEISYISFALKISLRNETYYWETLPPRQTRYTVQGIVSTWMFTSNVSRVLYC